MDYGQHLSTRETPQSEPIPGTDQVANSAGGFAWGLDDWGRLDRFLVLGSEGGSYYAGEHELTKENAQAIIRCLQADGLRAVARIVEISEGGRAPKNDPAIFALALAASLGTPATRQCAFAALPRVCRIGTHLFHFIRDVEKFRGWGRGLRQAIQNWYLARDLDGLAYQAIKYRQRDGWGHRDLLRLSHPRPRDPGRDALFKWITKDVAEPAAPRLVHAMVALQAAPTVKDVAHLIREHNLPREAVESASTKWLQSPEVWAALLERMPMTAMVRSLARMTAIGLVAPMSEAVAHICRELENTERITQSRLHPIALLSALRVYAQGHGERSKLTWKAVSQVVDALDGAFYLAFENVPVTAKRIVLALDVSGSMGGGSIAGIPGLTPRDVSAALALVNARRTPSHAIIGFTCVGDQPFRSGPKQAGYGGDNGVSLLSISPRMRLDTVVQRISGLAFGGTDCALPMLWALEHKVAADGFVILTDSETWAGTIHPRQALRRYREQTGIQAKCIVVGMVSNEFTIADPTDPGMLDIVGCDTATPGLIQGVLESDPEKIS